MTLGHVRRRRTPPETIQPHLGRIHSIRALSSGGFYISWRWGEPVKGAPNIQKGRQYTLCLKKVPTFKLSITLSNVNRFLRPLHRW